MPPRTHSKAHAEVQPVEGVLSTLRHRTRLRTLVVRGPVGGDAGEGLRSLEGLPAPHSLRVLRLVRCPALTDLSALASHTALRRVDVRGIGARDLRPLGHVEWVRLGGLRAVPRLRQCHGIRRLTLLASPRLASVPPDRLPPGLTHLHVVGCPTLGQGGLADLAGAATLRNLRVLDLRGCGGLPEAQRRVFLGAEIGVLLRGDQVPDAVQRRAAYVGDVDRTPHPFLRRRALRAVLRHARVAGSSRPSAETLRTFRAYGYADLARATAALSHPVRTLQFREDMAVLDLLHAAFADWQRCTRVAVRHALSDAPPEDLEEVVQAATLRILREAQTYPHWRFDQASFYAGLRSAKGFRTLAARYVGNSYRRQLSGWRSALRFGRPKKDPNAPEPEWRTVFGEGASDAGPTATERLSAEPAAAPDRGVVLARLGPGWQGALTMPVAPAEIVGFALAAVAPLWLSPRIGGRVLHTQDVSVRTLAALQPVTGVRTHTRHEELPLSLGVPAADLADPHLAELAWGALRAEERAAADAARGRAADAVERTLSRATEAEREAWRTAVALERSAAEGGLVDETAAQALEAAWLAVLGAATVGPQAKAVRQDAVKAAQKVLTHRRVRDLVLVLLGAPVPEDIGPDTWDLGALRALMAWCDAWARSAAFWQGVRVRRPAELAERLAALVDRARVDATPRVLRELLATAGLARRRADAVSDRRLDGLLAEARACVEAFGGAERAWAAAMSAAGETTSSDAVACVLDADERLAAAAWLDLGEAEDAVLAQLTAALRTADARARNRATRALGLVRARFPADTKRAASLRLLRIVEGLDRVDLPPSLAVALGMPVVLDADSSAYAADEVAAPLVPLGWRGAARHAWVGGDRLVLRGPGWQADGLTLVARHAGTPAEVAETRLPPGVWTLRHRDGFVVRLHVRDVVGAVGG
jgi:hypothetical protein